MVWSEERTAGLAEDRERLDVRLLPELHQFHVLGDRQLVVGGRHVHGVGVEPDLGLRSGDLPVGQESGVAGAGHHGRGLRGRSEESGEVGPVQCFAQLAAGDSPGRPRVGTRQLLVLPARARGGPRAAVVTGGQQIRPQPQCCPECREHGHGRDGLAPRVGFLPGSRRGGTLSRRTLRLRLRPDDGVGHRPVRGDRRSRVPACAHSPDHRVDAHCGGQQERHTDGPGHPCFVADGQIHDAYAEDGADHDEQGLTHPEGQEAEEETEHPAISSGQDRVGCDGSHSSGSVRNRDPALPESRAACGTATAAPGLAARLAASGGPGPEDLGHGLLPPSRQEFMEGKRTVGVGDRAVR